MPKDSTFSASTTMPVAPAVVGGCDAWTSVPTMAISGQAAAGSVHSTEPVAFGAEQSVVVSEVHWDLDEDASEV